MTPSNGPPVKNTRQAVRAARIEQTRATANPSLRERNQRPEQSNASARSETANSRESSALSSVEESHINESRQSESAPSEEPGRRDRPRDTGRGPEPGTILYDGSLESWPIGGPIWVQHIPIRCPKNCRKGALLLSVPGLIE